MKREIDTEQVMTVVCHERDDQGNQAGEPRGLGSEKPSVFNLRPSGREELAKQEVREEDGSRLRNNTCKCRGLRNPVVHSKN